jgi:hypothetical protein
MRNVGRLPWRRFPREPLVLFLVVAATFSVMNAASTQDETRLALSVSVLTRGTLNIDPYRDTVDKSYRAAHWYADKAPGLSFYALPQAGVALGVDAISGHHDRRVWDGTWHRWLLRFAINGPLLFLLCLALGRVAEGLVPGTGAAVAVVAGLGTLLGPLSTVLFEHAGAALLAFASLCLAWSRRHALAGLAAGCAVLFAYEAAIAAALLAGYVLLRGVRPAAAFVFGALPAAAALAAYDKIAFGSPFHLSYRYETSNFTALQHQGFFGFSVPSLQDFRAVLLGGSGLHVDGGILVTSPVAIAAAIGLMLLWRRGARREAALCAAVSAAYLVFDAGYYLPYGGSSPGPRFLATALPFLLVGLAPALQGLRRTTLALAIVSVAVMTINALTWMNNDGMHFNFLPDTVWAHAGLGLRGGVGAAGVLAAAAAVAALAPQGIGRIPQSRFPWRG